MTCLNKDNCSCVSLNKLLKLASTSRFCLTGLVILTGIKDKGKSHNKYLLVDCQLSMQISQRPLQYCHCVLTGGRLEPGHQHIQTPVIIMIKPSFSSHFICTRNFHICCITSSLKQSWKLDITMKTSMFIKVK